MYYNKSQMTFYYLETPHYLHLLHSIPLVFLPDLSGEISQYWANEFARCNRYCAAFKAVCIPMWPQSNYYSLYLCSLRQRSRKPCVLFPKRHVFEISAGHVHLFVFMPKAKYFVVSLSFMKAKFIKCRNKLH